MGVGGSLFIPVPVHCPREEIAHPVNRVENIVAGVDAEVSDAGEVVLVAAVGLEEPGGVILREVELFECAVAAGAEQQVFVDEDVGDAVTVDGVVFSAKFHLDVILVFVHKYYKYNKYQY